MSKVKNIEVSYTDDPEFGEVIKVCSGGHCVVVQLKELKSRKRIIKSFVAPPQEAE